MATIVSPRAPDFGDLNARADFHAQQFQERRRSLLSELRCVPGLVHFARAMKPDTLYKLVVPDGQLLQKGKDGLYGGVLYAQGKIQKHARFAAESPALMNAASAVASQVMLVSIAMQLKRIEAKIEGLSREMHRDRIAEVEAGVAQFETAMVIRDPATRRPAILNAVQTLHEGLGKTIAELRERIAQAPSPEDTLVSHVRYMAPFLGSKVDDAKKYMGLAQESFQATLHGIRILTECYAALGEGEAASRTLNQYLDRLAACDIGAAARKARLVEFTGSQPPQAVWDSFLKAEPVVRDRLKGLAGQAATTEIEFTLSDLQGDSDGTVP
jgi:hypothetical protein